MNEKKKMTCLPKRNDIYISVYLLLLKSTRSRTTS